MLTALSVMAVGLTAQDEVYEASYRAALADSVITADELQLLEVLQRSLGIEEEALLNIQRQVSVGLETSGLGISRAGRRRIMWNNMTYGNGLYGVGIPYVLDVKDAKVFSGMQLLSFAGGLYLTMNYTENMDLPIGRANFQIAGSGLGVYSLYPLVGLIGFERWARFDKKGKISLTYMMAAAPVGMVLSDKLYRRWQPSDGQSTAIIGGAGLGFFHALLGQIIVTPNNYEVTQNWLRLNSLLATGGMAGGAVMGWKAFETTSLTSGDAYFLGLLSTIGMINYFELLGIFEPESGRLALSLLLLTIDAHIIAGYKLGKPYDMTLGEVAIVGMGAMAGNATFRGLALILGIDQGGKGMLAVDIVTRMAGGYLTLGAIDPRREGTVIGESHTRVSLAPTLFWERKKTVPGLSLSVQF